MIWSNLALSVVIWSKPVADLMDIAIGAANLTTDMYFTFSCDHLFFEDFLPMMLF